MLKYCLLNVYDLAFINNIFEEVTKFKNETEWNRAMWRMKWMHIDHCMNVP